MTPRTDYVSAPTPAARLETLLKPADVARRLGVSRSWLYQAAKEGRIPSLRLGGVEGPLRFVEGDLQEWLEYARAAWQPGDTGRETLRRAAERNGGLNAPSSACQ